jgi:hypothetical protein
MKEFCQVFPLIKFVYINIKASQTMQLTHRDAINLIKRKLNLQRNANMEQCI